MGSFSLYFTDGSYTEFPQGGGNVGPVIEWFRDARDGQVITLRTQTGVTIHAQKRNITRIVVTA